MVACRSSWIHSQDCWSSHPRRETRSWGTWLPWKTTVSATATALPAASDRESPRWSYTETRASPCHAAAPTTVGRLDGTKLVPANDLTAPLPASLSAPHRRGRRSSPSRFSHRLGGSCRASRRLGGPRHRPVAWGRRDRELRIRICSSKEDLEAVTLSQVFHVHLLKRANRGHARRHVSA
jgi:hypothetical protein